jgi:penicillin-binding protein 1C
VFILLVVGGSAVLYHWCNRHAVLVVPAPTVLVEDVQGRFLAEVSLDDMRRGFWPLPGVIPQRILEATLAAEDARFYEHGGVDWRSAERALWQNLKRRRRVSGASTIAMQVARLQDPEPRTYVQKIAQASVARGLIKRYGHDAVLRHYLLIAPYGNQYHGVVYASRRFFSKPLEDLTWAEAALLAGLPKLPGRMNILHPKGRALAERRANYVLDRLRTLGRITEAERKEALELLPQLRIALPETRPRSGLHAAFAMEKVLREHPGAGGVSRVRVRSTLDLDLQEIVQLEAWKAMEKFRPEGAGNVAALVVERATGRILAYLGAEDYFDTENGGAIDYAQRPRSSGSTLKPFIYALGLRDRGFTAATLLTDVGMALNGRSGGYTIRNFDETFLGPILFRNALANSRNIPAIQVLEAVGVDQAYRHLVDLGLAKGDHDPAFYGDGLAIGAMPVTLVDLVRAYGMLANEGRAFDLRWFDEGVRPTPARQILPEDVARQITLFLSDPMARLPSFPRMGSLEYPFPVAVKTGTSKGFRDAWCVAYSERYLVGAWIGHPKNYPMNRTSGATSAGELVRAILETLHPEEMKGQAEHTFPPPRGWEAHPICLLSGKLASDDCPAVAVEWFKPGSEPQLEVGVHQRLQVDRRTGVAAGQDCPSQFLLTKSFTVLDPRFSAWARESGLELMPPELSTAPENSLRPRSFRLEVSQPRAGVLLEDPEAPASVRTLSLEATVDPPAPQVVWYVDGKPFKVVAYPYAARWRMQEGSHTFQIRLPYAPQVSPVTRVTIHP